MNIKEKKGTNERTNERKSRRNYMRRAARGEPNLFNKICYNNHNNLFK